MYTLWLITINENELWKSMRRDRQKKDVVSSFIWLYCLHYRQTNWPTNHPTTQPTNEWIDKYYHRCARMHNNISMSIIIRRDTYIFEKILSFDHLFLSFDQNVPSASKHSQEQLHLHNGVHGRSASCIFWYCNLFCIHILQDHGNFVPLLE